MCHDCNDLFNQDMYDALHLEFIEEYQKLVDEYGMYTYWYERFGVHAWHYGKYGLWKQYAYALFKNGDLVYIGISSNPKARLKQHRQDPHKDFDCMIIIKSSDDRCYIEFYERIMIAHFLPPQNNEIYDKSLKRSTRKSLEAARELALRFDIS